MAYIDSNRQCAVVLRSLHASTTPSRATYQQTNDNIKKFHLSKINLSVSENTMCASHLTPRSLYAINSGMYGYVNLVFMINQAQRAIGCMKRWKIFKKIKKFIKKFSLNDLVFQKEQGIIWYWLYFFCTPMPRWHFLDKQSHFTINKAIVFHVRREVYVLGLHIVLKNLQSF